MELFFAFFVCLQTSRWTKQEEQVSFNHTNPGLSTPLFRPCFDCSSIVADVSVGGHYLPVIEPHWPGAFVTQIQNIFFRCFGPTRLKLLNLRYHPRNPNGALYYGHRQICLVAHCTLPQWTSGEGWAQGPYYYSVFFCLCLTHLLQNVENAGDT